MTNTYQPSSGEAVSTVRMLIPDRDTDAPMLSDTEITAFLGLEGGDVRRAAAACLEMIASDQTLVLKAIRLMDLSTDGPKVAAALMTRAEKLRQQADATAAEGGSNFEWAELPLGPFSAQEQAEIARWRGW